MGIRAVSLFLAALLLLAPPLVVRCQSNTDGNAAEVEGGELGIVGEDAEVFTNGALSSAPGVDTVCIFPKNPTRLVPAGEEAELLVGIHNEGESYGLLVGESTVNVFAIRASLHLPFDHRMLVQNLTVQEFFNASVPFSAQATFPYTFAVSKYLQPGSFDLVGTVLYEIDQQPYQSVFYNGTIEVVEAGGLLSIESVFLIILGISLTIFFGVWAYNQIQHFSKKTKRVPKVEVGTRTIDADMDEWLEGTAYARSQSSKLKKK